MKMFSVWRWLIRCRDCGVRRCPVVRYADQDQDHRGGQPPHGYNWGAGEWE